MITVYGTVTELAASVPPAPEAPPEGPAPEIPPDAPTHLPSPLEQELRTVGVVPREGEEPLESWMHVHITLDPPHSGEIEINAPGFAVSSMLTVGGRARVMLSPS